MHYSDFDAASGSRDLSFDFGIGHLRENFSYSLNGLLQRHRVSWSAPLENVSVLVLPSAVIHVPHGELDPREPVTNACQ